MVWKCKLSEMERLIILFVKEKYMTILNDELRKGGNAQCMFTKILNYRQVVARAPAIALRACH